MAFVLRTVPDVLQVVWRAGADDVIGQEDAPFLEEAALLMKTGSKWVSGRVPTSKTPSVKKMTCLHQLGVEKVTILPVVQENQVKCFDSKLLLQFGDPLTGFSFN